MTPSVSTIKAHLSELPVGPLLFLCLLWPLNLYTSAHPYTADGLEQIELARCWAVGGPEPCVGLGYWPPLFALMTRLVGVFTESMEAAARASSLLMGALAPALAFWAGRHLTSRLAPGFLAAAAIYGARDWIFYSTMGDNRTLYSAVLILSIVALLRFWRRPEFVSAVWVGGAAGLGAMARPEGKALLPILALGVLLPWLMGPERRRSLSELAKGFAGYSLGALMLWVPFLASLWGAFGRFRVEARAWELVVIPWAQHLPKEMILGLFGYTVRGTPLRTALESGMAVGDIQGVDFITRLGDFWAQYQHQLPETLAQAHDALPTPLLIAALLGAMAMVSNRRRELLLFLALLSPFLLFPGLPQSANDKVPTGNYLPALFPLGLMAATGLGEVLRRWRGLWGPRLALVPAVGILALGAQHALATVAAIDSDLHLFEGSPVARALGPWIDQHLPANGRVVATYPGHAVAHFAGRPRYPMPSPWEMGIAMERWREEPSAFVIVGVDLYDDPMRLQELLHYIPEPCIPALHLVTDDAEWAFVCLVGTAIEGG